MTEQEILGQIGQIESTINKVESVMDNDEFEFYCIHAYKCVGALRVLLKKTRDNNGS